MRYGCIISMIIGDGKGRCRSGKSSPVESTVPKKANEPET